MARVETRLQPILAGTTARLGDHRKWPGCRVQVTCALCGWSRAYDPERLIARLRDLKAGGHETPLDAVAARVAWDCPRCHRVKWRAGFAWPPGLDVREAKRLSGLYRN